jgi:hypothetical protein
VTREVTEVNGSSIPEPEHEKQKKSKKIPPEPEDGKHPNNIRTSEAVLILEYSSAGNKDAKVAFKGNKVTSILCCLYYFSSNTSIQYIVIVTFPKEK